MNDFAKNLHFKGIKLPVKVRDMHKTEKKYSFGINVFGYGNKEKHPIYVSRKCCEDKHIINRTEKNAKDATFLSKIVIRSCMVIHYIVEEKIFVDIAYVLSVQKKN